MKISLISFWNLKVVGLILFDDVVAFRYITLLQLLDLMVLIISGIRTVNRDSRFLLLSKTLLTNWSLESAKHTFVIFPYRIKVLYLYSVRYRKHSYILIQQLSFWDSWFMSCIKAVTSSVICLFTNTLLSIFRNSFYNNVILPPEKQSVWFLLSRLFKVLCFISPTCFWGSNCY